MQGITPEALVERFRTEHQQDFAGFRVDFDNYYTTHSEENRRAGGAVLCRGSMPGA